MSPQSTVPVEPLSAEEIVAVHVGSMRAPDVMLDLTNAGYTVCGPDCGCSCLDAARASQPVTAGAREEMCGAILNCALPGNHDGLHERADGIRWSWHEDIDHLPRRPSAALPVREDEPTGIDPYRLTEAMRGVFDTTTRRRAVPYVEKIAAEYARLTREASHVR